MRYYNCARLMASCRQCAIQISFRCMTWLIRYVATTKNECVRTCHSCPLLMATWRQRVSQILFTCVTWLIYMCDMTQSHVRHDPSTCGTWLFHLCDLTHSCVPWWESRLSFCGQLVINPWRVMSHTWNIRCNNGIGGSRSTPLTGHTRDTQPLQEGSAPPRIILWHIILWTFSETSVWEIRKPCNF